MPLPGAAYVAMFVAIGLLSALPFLADRLLIAGRLGFFSTLAFPMAWVAIEFGSSRVNPYGTWGCLAYTQSGNLPLMQLVSVAGISGVAFLIAWTAAVANWAWDHRFEWAAIGPGILTYAAVAGATALGGGARLLRARQNEKTVRVAGIGWPEELLAQRDVMRLYTPPPLSETEQSGLRQRFKRVHEKFLHDTTREARAGAKIVVWPEASALAFLEDEPAYLERSQQAARDAGIYLLMGMGIIHTGQPQSMDNKAVLIGPAGEVCWSYRKQTAAGAELAVNIRGHRSVPTGDTPYGRIASPICFDMDFPKIVRQAGRAGVDALLVPASDWAGIGRLHLAMAVIRAVENGAAMIRVTRWGHSAISDPCGRTLAFMDDSATAERALVGQMPVAAGIRTIYSRAGDWFAWLCTVGLLLLLVIWAYGLG